MRVTKIHLSFLGLLLMLGFIRHADAEAVNFSFSFSSNPSSLQQQFLDVVPGTVTGLIEGLPENGRTLPPKV